MNDPRTDAELNRIIAEWMGWKYIRSAGEDSFGEPPVTIGGNPNYVSKHYIPYYCTDLNAMHEAFLHMDVEQRERFVQIIAGIEKNQFLTVFQQTQQSIKLAISLPRQRAEALVKVIEEDKHHG